MWANKVKPVNTDGDANKRNKNANDEYVTELDAKLLAPNPYQPRMDFNEEAIGDLAASIKIFGQLQPAVVCKRDDGQEGYYVVAGERRFRACKLLKRPLKCVIAPPMNARELQLIAFQENVIREKLHPVEVALAMQRLVETKVVESWADFSTMTELSGRAVRRYEAFMRLSKSAMEIAVKNDCRDMLVLETLGRRIDINAQGAVLQKIIDDGLERKEAVKYINAIANADKPQIKEPLSTKITPKGQATFVWKPNVAFKDAPQKLGKFQAELQELLRSLEAKYALKASE
jgi:ParB/RepB/Spo0J family partition protein